MVIIGRATQPGARWQGAVVPTLLVQPRAGVRDVSLFRKVWINSEAADPRHNGLKPSGLDRSLEFLLSGPRRSVPWVDAPKLVEGGVVVDRRLRRSRQCV